MWYLKEKIDVEKDLEMSHDEEEKDAADSQVLTISTCFTPNEEEEDAADSQALTPSTCLTPAVINPSEPSPMYEDLSPYSRNADEESPPKIRRR
ncbi:uncharacterized protein LOC106077540 isoform X5 [Biomphalaria glabrata]|uniref:Uncharacterized protein LOC106077540 isoform X5 n=1 Tax=Biomphalaria glabrata TaxID=6526 RepID=A0A9W2YBU1_BIOGL|nr:uncharacterized protein LOC106077540 isoform X5 [Biomphalaria glabrata]XP_055860234.1 uncharacterized protein LOC106077540 isoform X5 [Biomphalaria glabrata]XP_055860235.1 uncharacterized protein LOC106077540 isoform X5 [Biomphalaria glabrata]XP_055860236.1 uncharacterized protein LOC106077540 isoform X5 [Biomphalaria glabrata]XP_055860237.1 uncharacterized protein LOC106077540 isoform X5 [Biomphalaria glabrata]